MSKSFFDFSINYESDNIEAVAFSLQLMNRENQNAIIGDAKLIVFVLLSALMYMTFH